MLLELMLASALIGLIMTGLMASLYQLNTTQTRIDRVISSYDRASLLFHQLESDLTGVFLPVQNAMPQKEKQPAKPEKENTQAAQAKEPVEKPEEKKEPIKPIEDLFIGKEETGQLSFLSCVTCNPLMPFWGEKTGKAAPRVARVLYRLQPDPAHKGSFMLTREEGAELALEKYTQKKEKGANEYGLLDGIKNIRLTYFVAKVPEKVAQEKKEDAQKRALEALQKPRVYEQKNEWIIKKKEEKKDEKKQAEEPEPPLIPDFVKVELTLWDPAFAREEKATYTIALVTDMKKEKIALAEKEQPKKEPAKQGSPPGMMVQRQPIIRRGTMQRPPVRIAQGPQLPRPMQRFNIR